MLSGNQLVFIDKSFTYLLVCDFFFIIQAVINEDSSGDVIALKQEIQLLKVELVSYVFYRV